MAFDENIAATAPHMSLSVTTNAGASWHTVYTGPSSVGSTPTPSAFEAPMLFVSATRGFAATAIPPAEGQIDQGFFETNDGGSTWALVTPPTPRSTTCPSDNLGTIECLFALPSFSDATHAVLSKLVDRLPQRAGCDDPNQF